MWTLIDSTGAAKPLRDNETITLGRKHATIILDKDGSISKQHAKIQVTGMSCTVFDTGSKYGTFIIEENNKSRIGQDGYTVKDMCKIQFGLQHHIYTLSYQKSYKYFVLASGITLQQKKHLIDILDKVDGKLCEKWSEICTHTTTTTVKLTEKIACALAAGLPIVTIAYWSDLLRAHQNKESLPNVANYLPLLDSSTLVDDKVSLMPNRGREVIFKGYTFVHFVESQYQIYSLMIRLAGGTSMMYDENKNLLKDFHEKTIAIQPCADDSQEESPKYPAYLSVCEELQRNNLKSIHESDIPLAILYCSVERHCNPKYKYSKLLKSQKKEQTILQSTILTEETQDPKPSRQAKQAEVIPETAPFDVTIPSSSSLSSSPVVGQKRTSDCMIDDPHDFNEPRPVTPLKRVKQELKSAEKSTEITRIAKSPMKLSSFFTRKNSEATIESPVEEKIKQCNDKAVKSLENSKNHDSMNVESLRITIDNDPAPSVKKLVENTKKTIPHPLSSQTRSMQKRFLIDSDDEDNNATMKKTKNDDTLKENKFIVNEHLFQSDNEKEKVWIKKEPGESLIVDGDLGFFLSQRNTEKKYKRQYVNIPAQRLTRNDMYEWKEIKQRDQ